MIMKMNKRELDDQVILIETMTIPTSIHILSFPNARI